MKKFTPVTFQYDARMLPFFEEGVKQFTKQTMIGLSGINWEVKNGHLIVCVTEKQHEKYLFHLALCIGVAYAQMKEAV